MVSTRFTTRPSSSVLATVALTASLTALASGAFTPQAAHAQTTVYYGNLGTTTFTGTLSSGGITVTSPGVITVTQGDGLGISGGGSSGVIDNGETATFTFTGAATNVAVLPSKINGSAGSATTISAFGLGGVFLDTFTYYAPGDNGFFSNPDLSARVQNRAITSFRITGGSNSGANVSSVTFNGVTPTAVPEPSEWAVIGMTATTLGGLMVRARRRKNGANANA